MSPQRYCELVKERLAQAVYVARRSTIKSYKTGAVIYTPSGEMCGAGWSHYSDLNLSQYRSIHAELHAVLNAYKHDLPGSTVFVATLRPNNQRVCLAKPCRLCQAVLHEVGISEAYFSTEGEEWESIYLQED